MDSRRTGQGDASSDTGAGAATSTAKSPEPTAATVLVDLGRKRRKQLRALKRGEGPLVAELGAVIDQVREQLGAETVGKTVLPVVLIYERRRKRSWADVAGLR